MRKENELKGVRKTKRNNKGVRAYSLGGILLSFCLLLSVLLSGALARAAPYTVKAESQTPQVMLDLQKIETFNAADYPAKADDYSVQIIQIAEGLEGGLIVYTYQPCEPTKHLTVTEINMSLSESVDGTRLYGLTLLSSDGVFGKYKVNDFTISADAVRYYNITSIYRLWDKEIDKETGNDNTINEVSYAVGKLFKAKTENGNKIYSLYKETIEILNPYVDFLEYSNGFKLYPDWCRSHYIAFSTDKKIDILMEADVFYVKRSAYRNYVSGMVSKPIYGEPVEDVAPLDGKQTGGNDPDGWFSKKYEWERIQRVDEFIKTEDLKDSTITNLEGKQWVLRFVETEMSSRTYPAGTSVYWTDISQVSVLRLKFMTNFIIYNLGAVSDKVTGDDISGNNNNNELSLWDWLSRLTGIPVWVWKLLAALIPLAILLPILSIVFPVIGQILLLVFKGLIWFIGRIFKAIFWVIALPFKAIAALINKIAGK